MILPREFYARSTVTVARDLLGRVLVHGNREGIIVETEAYTNDGDLAAHSAAGITPRTKVIFGPPGCAYVYLSYGVHECFNIVAEPDGTAGCVLVRALEPVAGIDEMRALRPAVRHDHRLASGPGNLTRVMGITRALYGRDLTDGDFVVREAPIPNRIDLGRIIAGPRVGISKTVDLPYRFSIAGNRSVSV